MKINNKLKEIVSIVVILVLVAVVFYFVGYLKGLLMIPALDIESINDYKEQAKYKIYSKAIINDSFVNEVVSWCNIFNNSYQVDCVVSYVTKYYKYVDRDEEPFIKSPEQTAEEGGLCRDYYIMYAKIFEKLGWGVSPIFTQDHVYNNIFKKDLYCIVDMKRWECV